MTTPRLTLLRNLGVPAAILAFAAACGSSSGGGYGGGSTSTAPPAKAGATTVSLGSATVAGSTEQVLVAPDGKTLYYFTPDDATGSGTCTGSCASLWPPLTAASPTAAAGVTGKLAAVTDANGAQVTYNGHPLYEYAQDTAAGQANGEGVLGKWHVATAALAATAATPGGGTPSTGGSTGNGYGNGYGNG